MTRSKVEHLKSPKIISFWVLGAISAVIGGLISGNTKVELGTTQEDFVISVVIAGIMFLLTGFFWILASSELKYIEELVYEKG
jgi:sulfite exporter TauE/SafE